MLNIDRINTDYFIYQKQSDDNVKVHRSRQLSYPELAVFFRNAPRSLVFHL